LHGSGEHGDAYAGFAEAAATNGFIGITVSGPIAIRGGGRAWTQDSHATHEYIRGVLARSEDRVELTGARLFLCGFSQGATHAFDLLAARPDEYWGAIVLSPGEGPVPSAIVRTGNSPRPLVVTYGQNEYRAFRKRAQKFAAMWRRARWPCLLETHPGGHHLPADWERRFPRLLMWLAAQTKELTLCQREKA
jgi:predicted esterase